MVLDRTPVLKRFWPKKDDDLVEEARPLLGMVFLFYRAWVIDEGPYAGQVAWASRDAKCTFGWCPEEDLVDP